MSTFYYFPPWRKQYFFSADLADNPQKVVLFYASYHSVTRFVWNTWKASRIFRKLFSIYSAELPSLFNLVKERFILQDWSFQINKGTEGPEQKMSILAYAPNGEQKFIKAGVSETAKKLISNELNALIFLNGRVGAPKLIDSYMENYFSAIITETIIGNKLENTTLDQKLFNYICSISQLDNISEENGIKSGFSHGDCCPWNFLVKPSGDVLLIDWELSGRFPLGYDLFTFIFQTSFLLTPKKQISDILNDNKFWIEKYFINFSIDKPLDYLNIFIKNKIENSRRDSSLLENWQAVSLYLNN